MAFTSQHEVEDSGRQPEGAVERQAVQLRLQNFARLRPWLLGVADDGWAQAVAVIATRQCAAKRVYDEECRRLVALTAQGMATTDRMTRTWAEIQAQMQTASVNLKNGSQLCAGGSGSSTVKVAP